MASHELNHLLADLVRINSINPAYDQGVPESAMADFIDAYFCNLGLRTFRQEVFPGRPNLIAVLPGRNANRRIILEAHTDTASINGMTIPPFEPRIENGRLYGRGACDTKGGLAGMMHAVARLRKAGITPPCEVWLAATADEEYSYRGVLKLCDGLTAHAAVIAEPTEMQLIIASKGVIRWRIHVHGKAAHSSKPHLGVNAIEHTARLILAIEQDNRRLEQVLHPLIGCATSNVGVIHGGVQVNFVPDRCTIEIDRRLLPHESIEEVLADYQRLTDRLAAEHPGFHAEMEAPMLTDIPLDTRADEPAVLTASGVLALMGLDGTPAGVPFGSDASKLARVGIPSMVFGPGSIDQAHAAVEFVDLDQVELASEFYRRFITEFE
ncbi:MAG: M20 family metallopeptidase [Pirellulales bacterium]